MRFLPVFLDLTKGRVALIGAGEAAANKLRLLKAAGAHVRWYRDDTGSADESSTDAGTGSVEIMHDNPVRADLSDVMAVISAAGDPFDTEIAARARAANIPVNVVDRPELSTFIVPAIVDRGEVVVAIGTGGTSPVLARRLRQQIEALLPRRIGALAGLLGRYRDRFAALRHPSQSMRQFWERVIDGPIAADFLAGRTMRAEAALVRAVREAAQPAAKQPGLVYLVGAGPGDPDLLTLRALQVLQSADVIFHDDLVSPEILARARRDAELIDVGKRRGQPGIGQEAINRHLIAAARAGRTVIRLKGGDPFIFGRGGEELAAVRSAGISAIVVPGITAALGCAAEAGLPLTYRKEATRLCLITAHQADAACAVNWAGLGDPQTTVVVYMGLATAAVVRDGLIAAGRAPATPVAVLARGTNADSRRIYGDLEHLPALAAEAGPGPAILVIGDVVAHAERWEHVVPNLTIPDLTEVAA